MLTRGRTGRIFRPLSRPRADILPVWPSHSVNEIDIKQMAETLRQCASIPGLM